MYWREIAILKSLYKMKTRGSCVLKSVIKERNRSGERGCWGSCGTSEVKQSNDFLYRERSLMGKDADFSERNNTPERQDSFAANAF